MDDGGAPRPARNADGARRAWPLRPTPCPARGRPEPRLLNALQPLVRDLQLFDADLVGGRVKRRDADLAWPGALEVPARHFGARLSDHDDGAVGAGLIDLALLHHLAPLPGVHRVGDAALEVDDLPLEAAGDR